MDVLVIGSGGREHALTWALKKDKNIRNIYCAPGNAGTALIAQNINISADKIDDLLKFAKEKNIGLSVVGPEVPLVKGIVNVFCDAGLTIFGPDKNAAMLEGSKEFTKNLLKENKIPTAEFERFNDSRQAKTYIKNNKKYPVVIKADGLAAGKGVIICENENDAIAAIDDIMNKKIFGSAGYRIIIEEFLEGEEASIIALTDGNEILLLPPSQDHKRIYDDDKGPNTGGMGAYAPTPLVDKNLIEQIKRTILYPTLEGLKKKKIIYKGVLYAGLMITKQGPKVLEYNCRFGDPETQSIVPLIDCNLFDLFIACTEGKIKDKQIKIKEGFALNVVIASNGYPGKYEVGKEIFGLEKFKDRQDIIIFHAGTKIENGKVITNGGRVLNFTGIDKDIERTIKKVYDNINEIKFDGAYFRKDIGKRALKYIR
ncbi:MAG: phosphoribosylamine--glycine ligase [Candidatus Goldbacteria bacterium]|nr:phosphoribosylamine--glycine ligase [Candidatus Goldiibacteriota bacterium]